MDILIKTIGLILFLWLTIACVVFQWRHPKANDAAVIQEISTVLKFGIVEEYRK